MRNPGSVKQGSEINHALIDFAKALAKEFEIAEPAALGQLLKLHNCLCYASDSTQKMSNLIIDNKPDEGACDSV